MDREFEEEQTLLSKNKEWSGKLMKEQKKNESGITLVALVVSIIVMLVLAGVSLNATIGENGIVTRAQEAREAYEMASELEALQMAVASYNVGTYTGDIIDTLDIISKDLFRKELIDYIDGTKDAEGNYIDFNRYEDENGKSYALVKKGKNAYRIFFSDDNIFEVDRMPEVGGGSLKGGTFLVSKNAFSSGEGVTDQNEKGKFTIEGDAKVIFNEPLGVKDDGITASGEMLSIQVKSGTDAKIYFYSNAEKQAEDGITYYKLTNEGLHRSAIDVESGGTLSIYIGKNVNVTVDSGFGSQGTTATGNMVGGGMGGFAGIHVPKFSDYNYIQNVEFDQTTESDITKTNKIGSAVLKISGEGTLVCYGGSAGSGGNSLSGVIGGGGGGGAGAGIGGNGGKGGNSGYGTENGASNFTKFADDGEQGEDCGNISIEGNVTVYAFGGGGGSGSLSTTSAGSGAGGYPAAGIGGGGAGGGAGGEQAGGGGYSGGNQEPDALSDPSLAKTLVSVNGNAGYPQTIKITRGVGGGYYQDLTEKNASDGVYYGLIGGGAGGGFAAGNVGANGGVAGQGGVVEVSSTATVEAYNGNRYTDKQEGHNNPEFDNLTKSAINTGNQCEIYAQNGIYLRYATDLTRWTNEKNIYYSAVLGKTISYSRESQAKFSTFTTLREYNATGCGYYKQGIGSGAGFLEISNGSYKIDGVEQIVKK